MKDLIVWRRSWGHAQPPSRELSIKLLWQPRYLWAGAYWQREWADVKVYICILPCLPLRIHCKTSWGGIFPPRDWLGRGVTGIGGRCKVRRAKAQQEGQGNG